MTSHSTFAAVLLGASALLTACGGGTQSSPMGALPTGSMPMQSTLQPQDGAGCPNDGGLTVRPCRIKFDANNPGPTGVTVTRNGDGDRHTIKERDDCASRNIASVMRDTNHRYTVTAGTATGSCTAQFSDGNRNDDGDGGNGGAQLRVVNKL
jgi:hypothetical protein